MVDLATFAANPDNERFEKSMQSRRTAGVRPLAISNKGIPKYRLRPVPNGEAQYSAGNNVGAEMQYTFGGGYPAYTFIGTWRSNSSQVLVHYDLDNVPDYED